MTKKKSIQSQPTSTYEEFVQSMTPKQKIKHEKGYHKFVLSELLLAIMKNDAVSVRKLAKEAGISPAIIQGIRSGEKQNITMQSFFKILQALGCSIVVKKDKEVFPLELIQS